MSAAIQGIYIALFGRPADPGGLAYWMEVTRDGADLSEMLRVLPSLPEYTERFEGQTPAEVITTIYMGLFGREPDAEGLKFFQEQLASGAQNMATIAVNILHGAQGDDKADVEAKLEAAEMFTASLDTPEKIAAYTGENAADLARAFLDKVDKDAPATEDVVESAVNEVVTGEPDEGQAPGGGTGGGSPPTGGGDDDEEEPEPEVDAPVSSFGMVNGVTEAGKLHVGSGNSTGNFNITKTSLSEIEIALKGYARGEGDRAASGENKDVYTFDPNDKAGFAYSVASLGGKTIGELMDDGYSFHLKVDNHPGKGFGTKSATFTLEEVDGDDKDADERDSGYNWIGDVGTDKSIYDDQGTGLVSQNIQSPAWYGAPGRWPDLLSAGEYSVSLEVRKDGDVVATEEITLDVATRVTKDELNDTLSSVAMDPGTTKMIHGGSNSGENFSIVQVDGVLEIGLGAQVRQGTVVEPSVSGAVVDFTTAQIPTFKFSVASLGDQTLADLLEDYDIQLWVDQDPKTSVKFVKFSAVETDPEAGETIKDVPGALDWKLNDSVWIRDDAGNEDVSQNIHALSWYQGSSLFSGDAAAVGAGEYTVAIAVFDKGTTNLVGYNALHFDVAGVTAA